MRYVLLMTGFMFAAQSPADAWTHSGGRTGPQGRSTSWSASRTAAGAQGSFTGPAGNTTSGTIAPTQYGYRAQVSGPNGGTATGQGGSVVLPNGQTVYGGVVTGPNGGKAGGVAVPPR